MLIPCRPINFSGVQTSVDVSKQCTRIIFVLRIQQNFNSKVYLICRKICNKWNLENFTSGISFLHQIVNFCFLCVNALSHISVSRIVCENRFEPY